MPSGSQYMHQMMQTLASATAAALMRGVPMDRVSLHAIDYAHFQGNSLFHASLTDYDGSAKLTWSYDCDGGRRDESKGLTQEQLEFLWNGLTDSAVFQRSIVQDAGVEIDPFTFHVIGFASQEGAIPAIGLFLVPATENDADFESWLLQLQPPDTYEFHL